MKEYDPTEYTMSFAGIIPEGYADGEFLRVVQPTDDFADVVGTDGEVSRSKTMDRRADVFFILMQTSATNSLLSALSNADRNLPGGAGVGSLFIRDRQGTTVFRAAEAWIVKAPDSSFDRQATSREWRIRCAKLERFDGGN